MKNNKTTNWIQRVVALTTTATIAAVPFLSLSPNVEAQPRRGYNPNWNDSRTTLTGTVTRDLRGDSFELRADNGRTYRVRVGRYDQPRSLDRGDRVRVVGEMGRNDVFNARNIDFIRDTRDNRGPQHTITGVVTRDLIGDSFEIRAENGRTYWVRAGRYDEPRSLNRGDRVRVTGRITNNEIVANDIDFLRDRRR